MRRDGGGKGCVSAGLGVPGGRADQGVGLQLGITDSCSGGCGQGWFLMVELLICTIQHSALCVSPSPTLCGDMHCSMDVSHHHPQ